MLFKVFQQPLPVIIGTATKMANTGCYFPDSTKTRADVAGAVVLDRRPKLGYIVYSEI
jgi:hypothetical protein